jgi:hypothetical protein
LSRSARMMAFRGWSDGVADVTAEVKRAHGMEGGGVSRGAPNREARVVLRSSRCHARHASARRGVPPVVVRFSSLPTRLENI